MIKTTPWRPPPPSSCSRCPAGRRAPRRSATASASTSTGTWNETVRADLDADDSRPRRHRGGRRPRLRRCASRCRPRWPTCRCARPRRQPLYDVAADVADPGGRASTFTDFYGTSGHVLAAGRGRDRRRDDRLGRRGRRVPAVERRGARPRVRRSRSRATACRSTCCAWRRPTSCPELGDGADRRRLRAPAKRFGDWRITLPVAASAAQRAFERCPREDPGHTVACPFGWDGHGDARPAHARGRPAAAARRRGAGRRPLRGGLRAASARRRGAQDVPRAGGRHTAADAAAARAPRGSVTDRRRAVHVPLTVRRAR